MQNGRVAPGDLDANILPQTRRAEINGAAENEQRERDADPRQMP